MADDSIEPGDETADRAAPSGAGQAPVPGPRLLIVDDHAILREGLRRILESALPAWTVIEADGALRALDLLARQPVDVVITDLSMPGMSGLELTRRVKEEYPGIGLLVLSMHTEAPYALRAFENGADGYLSKASVGTELVAAVRKVAAGGLYVTPDQAELAIRRLSPQRQGRAAPAALSGRELDVLRRLVAGERPKEIARALDLSIKTISSHKARMLEKLQLASTAALIRYAIEQGLVAADGPAT